MGAGGGGIANLLETMRTSPGGGQAELDAEEDEGEQQLGTVLDPTKLDPIQAAMYVSQMYEKEARNKTQAKTNKPVVEVKREKEPEAGGEDDEEDGEDEEEEIAPMKDGKQIFPKHLYDKMKRFYATHDPTRLNTIEVGDVEVNEDKLDADLKKRFGVGLNSVE